MRWESGFNLGKEVDSFYWLKLHCRDETFYLAILKFLFSVESAACWPVCPRLHHEELSRTLRHQATPLKQLAAKQWDLLAVLVVSF